MIRRALAFVFAALAVPTLAFAHTLSATPEATDTLTFTPGQGTEEVMTFPSDSMAVQSGWHEHRPDHEVSWLSAPFEDEMLAGRDHWGHAGHAGPHTDFILAYNRVDPVSMGIRVAVGRRETLYPRVIGRIEYAFGRERTLYGVLIDQPIVPGDWVAIGGAFYRRTAYSELRQVGTLENSIDLFTVRADFRDYWEREGEEGYVALRLRHVTELSVRVRSEDHRSLDGVHDLTSIVNGGDAVRPNPAIDDGRLRSWAIHAERRARRSAAVHPGVYHWGEVEWAGHGMGGDFQYRRALGDVRGYVRLSPGQLLALRVTAGSALEGTLPLQKQFTVGGVDGLRAHAFDQYRGDQMMLGQAEYSVSLWRPRSGWGGALQFITFVDSGKAWNTASQGYQLDRQRMPVDGGLGLATGEDEFRVYLAKNLQEPSSNFLVSVRLQRAF